MNFEERIKDLRIESKLTAKELVSLIRLNGGEIKSDLTPFHWENGRAYPKVNICLILCQIFDCSMDYLLGLSDNRHGDVGLSKEEGDLIETVRKLRPERAKEVSDFALFLQEKDNAD